MEGALPEKAVRRLDPIQRYGLRLTLLGIAIVLVAIPFATLLFQVLLDGPVTEADGDIADALNRTVAERDWAVDLLQIVSWLARPPFLALLVAATAVHVYRRHQRRLLWFVILTPLGGGIVDSIVKIAVNRPRPEVDHPIATAFGKSFPSGHAMSSVVTYGALLLVFLPLVSRGRRHLAVGVTVVLILAIGVSRLLLGLHFVSDVIGGWVLGLAWLLGAVAAFETWRTDEGDRKTHPLDEGVEPEAAEVLR
jgi:undecaprenyl-diphosphatase